MSNRPRRWRVLRAVAKRVPFARKAYRARLRRKVRLDRKTVIVYVDGFNLYRNVLKYHPELKWLDLYRLCSSLMPGFQITLIRYFTADIRALMGKDPRGPSRQQAYHRALALDSHVRVHKGRFQTQTRWAEKHPIEIHPDGHVETVRVRKIEEKQSDVSLGAWMVLDASRGDADVFMLLSNDSDFAGLCEIMRTEIRKPFGLISPTDTMTKELLKQGPTYVRKLRYGALAESQLPDEMSDSVGTVRRPSDWR